METLFVFECTIVNLATCRQFTYAAWDWIIKKKKKNNKKNSNKKNNNNKKTKPKTKQNKTKVKKKIQNCIKSGLSQFLFLQQKM